MKTYEIHIEISYHKNIGAVSIDMFGCKELNIPYQSSFLGENDLSNDAINYFIRKNIDTMKAFVYVLVDNNAAYSSIQFDETEQFL